MSRLRHRDVTAFSHALHILYADTRAETLSKRVSGTLRALFDCEFASFSMSDERRGPWKIDALDPVVREWPGMDLYRRFLREDPVANHIVRKRMHGALKVSDFLTLRQYRSSPLYSEIFKLVGCDRRLGFVIHTSQPAYMAATLNRRRLDFREEERALLELLRDHLLQAKALAHTHGLADAVRAEVPRQGQETYGVGLVEIDAEERLCWLTARAGVLLHAYYPRSARRVAAGRLPDELERQIKGRVTPGEALLLHPPARVWYQSKSNGRKLKIRLAAQSLDGSRQLLLEEEVGSLTAAASLSTKLGLTAREGEVLHWLAEGMTNLEISQALGNREATVSKHLERVFTKLGVSNRAAATRVVAEARAEL